MTILFADVVHSMDLAATVGSERLRKIMAVLLGSTRGVALLVRTRTVGATYWCALAMITMLAVCAFVSFDALRTLVLTWAGFSSSTA